MATYSWKSQKNITYTITYNTKVTNTQFTFTLTKMTARHTDTSKIYRITSLPGIYLYNGTSNQPHTTNKPTSTPQIPANSTVTIFSGSSSVSLPKTHYTGVAQVYNSANYKIVNFNKLQSWTVSYNANGGSGAPGNQTKWYGETLTLSSIKPTRTGYTFVRWVSSGRSDGTSYFQPGNKTNYNGAQTLKAEWKINTWTVSYNANGGSGAPGNQTKTYNQTLTLSSTKPTRTGYTFKNWNTKANGSGTTYNSGQSYTTNAAISLYAQWKINTWTVSYNANGGSGVPSSQTKTYNQTLTLSSTKPTRTDYKFKGWATSPNGTIAYQPGSNYTLNQAVTLYAIWEQVYFAPTISNLTATRAVSTGGNTYVEDDEGTVPHIKFNWTKARDNGSEIKPTCYIAFAIQGQAYTNEREIPLDNYTNVCSFYGNVDEVDTDKAYSVRIKLVTSNHPDVTATTFITLAYFIMDVNADGTAIGFGRPAPDNQTGVFVANNFNIYKGTNNITLETKETTISKIITADSTNATITTANFIRRGNIAQLYIEWKNKKAISVPASGNITNFTVGTLVNDKVPAINTGAWSNGDNGGAMWYSIYVSGGDKGKINLGACEGTGTARTIAAGETCRIFATYIIE